MFSQLGGHLATRWNRPELAGIATKTATKNIVSNVKHLCTLGALEITSELDRLRLAELSGPSLPGMAATALDPQPSHAIGDPTMNLPINPAVSAAFSADTDVLSATFGAARKIHCPVCAALAGEECAYTTAPVSVPVVPGSPMRPVHGYHAARLDAAGAAGADLAGVLGASTVVWDDGDAPRLPAPAETGDSQDAARDVLSWAKEKLDNVGCLLYELAAALDSPGRVAELAAELLDEDHADEDDDAEPYCVTCGEWAGIFHGHGGGWHHYRGEGTLTSPVELFDAGHEVAVGWTVPAARLLSPASMGLIRQALLDAAARRSERIGDDERAAAYTALGRRLVLHNLGDAVTAGGGAA
jgi:hypothetical protein